MKMQKKLAGFSACALVLSSLTVPVAHAASVDFKDIDSHWAKSSIERWAGYEIVNGFGNDQFKPEDTMTRAQMAQILSKTLGLTATTTTNPFTDVSDSDWFADAILKCNAAGIMNGTSATTAKPNAQISRQEAVTMMGRALGIEADGDSTAFDDNSSIGDWAVGFVNAMAKRGIVNGRSEGVFAPTGDIKRGEITTILDRAITTYVNTPDTEVTATGKGITLIAAPGVTVKGEAEDILVAPAATGTTKLDSVKVSGAVTMQAANGVLVLSGTTTAAKLNVPALATGAKITIEQNATVAAMNSAADNVTVDGSGNITEMTVAGGKGVTVAGAVKVGKITNNGSDPVTKGNTTVAANTSWSGTTTNTGGGGGGGGGGGSHRPRPEEPEEPEEPGPPVLPPADDPNNSDESPDAPITDNGETIKPPSKPAETDEEIAEDNAKTWATVEDFVGQAQRNASTVVAKIDPEVDSMGNFEIINNNDSVDTLTLNLANATAGSVTVRADNVGTINIQGSKTIDNLTIYAPKAIVNNEVATGTVNIEEVDVESYHAKKKHGHINMNGRGHIAVDYVTEKDDEKPVIAVNADKGKAVKVSGSPKELNVNSPVVLTLTGITNDLKVRSAHKDTEVTVDSDNITLSGKIGKLNAEKTVTMSDVAVTKAEVADGVEIKKDGDKAASIGTLEAKGDVTVGVNVDMLKPDDAAAGKTITVGAGATVKSVTTAVSVAVAGDGAVNSVDVAVSDTTTEPVEVKAMSSAVKHVALLIDNLQAQLDKLQELLNKITVTPSSPEVVVPPVRVKQSAPKGLDGILPTNPDTEDGDIINIDTTMEWRSDSEEKYHKYETANAKNFAPGMYFVRKAGQAASADTNNTEILASESVRVEVPKAIAVSKAAIQGSAIVYQTLTAVANSDATGKLSYQWYTGETAITGATNSTLQVKDTMVGYKLKVIITDSYGKSAPSTFTAIASADMGDYNKALKEINSKQAGVQIAANAGEVPAGTQWVTSDMQTALNDAISDAAALIPDDKSKTTENVNNATKILTDALAAYTPQPGEGTSTETALGYITDLIAEANDLKSAEAKQSNDNGLDIAPNEKWYPAAALEKLEKAIEAAGQFTASNTLKELADGKADMQKAIDIFEGQLMNGAPIDLTGLATAVAGAVVNQASVETSDGLTELYIGTVYVTQAQKDVYGAAINTAMGNITKAPSTQKGVLNALNALNTATATFNGQKVSGTVDKEKAPEIPAFRAYTITCDTEVAHVKLTVAKEAAAGSAVAVTATPDAGYTVATVTVTDANNNNVATKKGENNTWTFTMPAENVTVSATATQSGATSGTVSIGSITYIVNNDTTATNDLTTDAVTITPASANVKDEVTISIDKTKVSLEGYTLDSDVATVTLNVDDNMAKLTDPTIENSNVYVWSFTMPEPAMDIEVNVVFKMSWTDPNAES